MTVKIEEVVDKIVGGGTPSKNNPLYWNGSIPWASVKDLSDGRYFLDSTEDTITELGLKHSASNLISAGTIVLSTRMGLGRVAKTAIDVAINQDLKAIYPNNKIHKDYLLWSLVGVGTKLKSLGSGSTVSGIRLEDLKNLEINLPGLTEQREIAETLNNYDLLIQLNEKRVKILEEMAQRLYTEWFVHFRFPGHEQVKMVESGTEYGLIPEDWKIKSLGELTSYLSRGISPTYNDEGMSVVLNQKCIRNHKINFNESRKQIKSISKEKLVLFGDILINSTGVGTLGRVAQVYQALINVTVDSHITIVRPVALEYADYLGLSLLIKEKDIENMGAGATGQTELSRTKLAALKILLPRTNIIEEFSNNVKNLRLEVVNLLATNTKLIITRDLLISKLLDSDFNN